MPAQKRKAPDTPETSGRRRSGRISSSGKKSQYFDGDTDLDDEDDSGAAPKATSISQKKRGRGRPPKSATSTPAQGRPTNSKAKKARKTEPQEDEEDDGEEYADEEEQHGGGDGDDDDELGSDEEPRVTITPLTKMRETGGIPYEDERLHKNTMLFLKDLKANNKRSWLKGS